MNLDVVLVKWADAHDGGIQGWTELGEYVDDGEVIITTVGLLIPEHLPGGKKGHVTVWQTVTDGEGINPFHIPVGMVRTLTVLCCTDTALSS